MADQSTAPDAAQRAALATSFRSITASTADAAVFFLEGHSWNLDAAIQSFFDADEEPEEAPPAAATPAAAVPRPNAPPPAAASKKPSGSGGGGGSGRPVIRTLADLNHGGGSDSEDDEDRPTEYYAGGEKSGMLVQDPSKGNRDVDSLFEQARQRGATAGPPLDHHSSSSSRSFTGTGRLLSGDSVAPAPTAPTAPQQSGNVIHTISFWTNGFTIDDGPLRRFDDPENASFLESIAKSECPEELAPADRRTGVSVSLVRRDEKYQEPKRSIAFQGVGRTLGDGSASGSATVQPTVTTATLSIAPDSSIGLSVNASLPSTSVQLRLADGTRMVARFNTAHTVGHIRAFIDASRPGASRTYQLQTVGFPPKQLADQTQTIEQAGLANSVIVQRL